MLDVPERLDVTATSSDGARVSFPVSASDDVAGPVAATCEATDAGNTATGLRRRPACAPCDCAESPTDEKAGVSAAVGMNGTARPVTRSKR